jgi:endonuclease/exonuclease/phosphatase (EEP) superfamily protein YafD
VGIIGGARLGMVLAALFVAPFAAWAVVRLSGLERGWPLVPLMAFTPYAGAASALPLITAVALRCWPVAVVAALTTLALAWCVLPRAIGRADPGSDRPRLRVLTNNLLWGTADPDEVLALVRQHHVDLLALQEYTPAAEKALHSAGMAELLQYRVTHPLDEPGGSALYSRFPLTDHGYRALPPNFGQSRATLRVPGAGDVLVESVHPASPSTAGWLRHWRTGLSAQPPAMRDGPVRILLGDFNATLDHAPLRRLLRTGYRCAAGSVGAGLAGTWPYDGTRLPRVAIDHVLVDRRVAVHAVSVHRVTGTDHRAVLAELGLPTSGPPGATGRT